MRTVQLGAQVLERQTWVGILALPLTSSGTLCTSLLWASVSSSCHASLTGPLWWLLLPVLVSISRMFIHSGSYGPPAVCQAPCYAMWMSEGDMQVRDSNLLRTLRSTEETWALGIVLGESAMHDRWGPWELILWWEEMRHNHDINKINPGAGECRISG